MAQSALLQSKLQSTDYDSKKLQSTDILSINFYLWSIKERKGLGFYSQDSGKGYECKAFSRYLCVLKGFYFLSFLFLFFFSLSLLNPDEDLGVARPSMAFLFLSIFVSHLLLLANTEKDACNLELY